MKLKVLLLHGIFIALKMNNKNINIHYSITYSKLLIQINDFTYYDASKILCVC